MRSLVFLSQKVKETIQVGARVARHLKKGDIVCLFGELGTGKTTLTKGIAQGLRIKNEAVSSPTFILMNIYDGRVPLFHFDLYRIDDSREMLNIGFEEYVYDEGISVIEWAQKLGALLPREYLKIELVFKKENERLIRVTAHGRRAKEIVKEFKNESFSH